MGATATKFPLTHRELLDISGGALARFPASFAEYWELLREAEYKADYSNAEIIAMSYETNPHSKLASEIMFLLHRIFDSAQYAVHNSNRPVYIAAFQAVHNPDCSVVLEPAQLFKYQPGMNAETTPVVVVEVLSKTTRDYDRAEKLPHYQQIPSLRQIIYVDSARMAVTVYERPDEAAPWIATDLTQPTDQFLVNGQPVTVADVYRKVTFED